MDPIHRVKIFEDKKYDKFIIQILDNILGKHYQLECIPALAGFSPSPATSRSGTVIGNSECLSVCVCVCAYDWL